MMTTLVVSALVMGLLGGAHCVVMCGGIVGVLCAGVPPSVRARPLGQLRLVLAYNLGRVASYAIMGGIAGALGALADRIDGLYGAQIGLRVIAGVLMLGVGLFMAGLLPRFSRIEALGAPMWRRIAPVAKRLLPVETPRAAFALGIVWGFLPCGLVYAALAIAIAAGSAPGGALAMAAFGLGTLPTLVAMGGVAGAMARLAKRTWLRRSAGIAIAVFGVVNLATAAAQANLTSTLTFGLVQPCCATRR